MYNINACTYVYKLPTYRTTYAYYKSTYTYCILVQVYFIVHTYVYRKRIYYKLLMYSAERWYNSLVTPATVRIEFEVLINYYTVLGSFQSSM